MIDSVNFGGKKIVYMLKMGDFEMGPNNSIQFKNILLPFKTYTQQLYQGKKMTMRDSEA